MSLDLDALENVLNLPETGVALMANRDYRMNQTEAVAHPLPDNADMQVNDIIKIHDFLGRSTDYNVSIGSAADTFDYVEGPLVFDKGEGTYTIMKVGANAYEYMFENGAGDGAASTLTLGYGRMSKDGSTSNSNNLGLRSNPTKAVFETAVSKGIGANPEDGTFTISNQGSYRFNAYHSAQERSADMIAILFVDNEENQLINSQSPGMPSGVHHFWFQRVDLASGATVDVRYAGAGTSDNTHDQDRPGVVEYFEAEQVNSQAIILTNTQIVRDQSYETNLSEMTEWDAETINQLVINVTENGYIQDPLNINSGDITQVFLRNSTSENVIVGFPEGFSNYLEGTTSSPATIGVDAGKTVLYSMTYVESDLFWSKLSA